jgi:hypothetical protein
MEIKITLKNFSSEYIRNVVAYDCVNSPFIFIKTADGEEIYVNPSGIISFTVAYTEEPTAEDAE